MGQTLSYGMDLRQHVFDSLGVGHCEAGSAGSGHSNWRAKAEGVKLYTLKRRQKPLT